LRGRSDEVHADWLLYGFPLIDFLRIRRENTPYSIAQVDLG
jgi:hypothetical protein